MSPEPTWESHIADLLQDLAGVQDELLEVLEEKRNYMAAQDHAGMERLQARESELCDRLQSCHDRRSQLLDAAQQEGLPGGSLQELASAIAPNSPALPTPSSVSARQLASRAALAKGENDLPRRVQETSQRMRLLQHHSLTNWVLAQRTLLHLSQMLEILASGGRLKPTYGQEESHQSRGALVDREA